VTGIGQSIQSRHQPSCIPCPCGAAATTGEPAPHGFKAKSIPVLNVVPFVVTVMNSLVPFVVTIMNSTCIYVRTAGPNIYMYMEGKYTKNPLKEYNNTNG
jgi:hypothetical protein